MGAHFWPGVNITVPFTETVDAAFVQSLPETPGHEGMGPGWDQVAVDFRGGSSVAGIVYNIVGEGRDVVFYVLGSTQPQVITMELIDIEKPDTGDGTVHQVTDQAIGSSRLVDDPTPPYAVPSVAIKYFLVAGKTYHLFIDNGYYSDGPPAGFVVDPWTLSVRYASDLVNDLRDDALDVVITATGRTYTGPKMLNTGYTASPVSSDDGPLVDAYCTGWWRYVPEFDTNLRASTFVHPENFPLARVSVYRADPITGALSTLYTTQDNPAVFDVAVNARDIIYFQFGLTDEPLVGTGLIAAQYYELWVRGSKTVLQPPPPEPGAENPGGGLDGDVDLPVVVAPWDSNIDLAPDKFKPDAVKKPETDSGSKSLLDLVRDFSSAVRRAVRITGSHTIEMVDPAVPLPAGWFSSDATALYSSTARSAAAEAKTLSVRAGDVKVSASAHLKRDDVRLPKSSWRLPDRLPVYGLPAAPVKSVSYTFSPTGFDASVEFHFAAVPIEARRI